MTDEQNSVNKADEQSPAGEVGEAGFHFVEGDKIPTAQTDRPAANGQSLMKAGVILLNRAEVQSGSDRQRHAEGLILQLPDTHDGRNTWLLNYGVSDEAQARRDRWNEQAVKCGREPICVMNDLTRSAGSSALLNATGASQ